MKKGQVTAFVVVGIVIVAAAVFIAIDRSSKRDAGGLEEPILEKDEKMAQLEAVKSPPEELMEETKRVTFKGKEATYASYEPYLASGEQTVPGKATMAILENIEGETKREVVQNILTWQKRNLGKTNCPDPEPKKRSRTAEEIISSRCVTGCIDSGLAFVTLARAKGIPAVYVSTVKEEWINAMKVEGWIMFKEGHVFSDVFLEDEDMMIVVDPAGGRLSEVAEDGAYLRGKEEVRYLVLEKGLDSWGVGLRKDKDLKGIVMERYNILE